MHATINFLSASTLAAKIGSGDITSRQAVEAFFTHIRQHNGTFNAIATSHEAQALALADLADQSRCEGKPCGPLHGVPITIKDTYRVAGSRTTAGYLPLKDYIPDTDI